MTNLNKRVDVARRLRDNAGEKSEHLISWAVFNDAEKHEDIELVNRLIDLIDPLCKDFGGQEGTVGETYDFACSRCGFCSDVTEPNYCPNCGARVVDWTEMDKQKLKNFSQGFLWAVVCAYDNCYLDANSALEFLRHVGGHKTLDECLACEPGEYAAETLKALFEM